MSNEPGDDGRMIFYYSREERLKKASPAVREMNTPSAPYKPNLFRTLTATKPLMFLFISMVTLCVTIVIISRFILSEGTRTLGNNTVTVSAISSGGKSYITVKKVPRRENAYTGAVDVVVSPVDTNEARAEGDPVFPLETRRFYFTLEAEELFRFSAPFTGKKLLVLMEAGPNRILFSISPEQ
ncbi:hypothetical protein AGMMS50230_21170 [Spirochaetia bacterium]|nr:hypothetical protein AGMMS50230_21170 [Spirochaetia bacterium]